MEQHKILTFEGRKIHYRDEGRDNPQTLVLLHGFLQNLDVWSSYTLSYMRSMRVITIDLPGHGYTDTFSDVHTMDFMARIVKAVLDHAGVDQCVMVGHSMGGYVALAFADQYPYMLRGLGLIHSHALADTEESHQRRLNDCEQAKQNRAGYIINFIPNLFDDSHKMELDHEIKDLQAQCLETEEKSIRAAQMGMSQRPSRVNVLCNSNFPIMFIFGKNDPRLPVELAVTQAMMAKKAEIHILDGVAHMAHLEMAEYVKLRLMNFVNTCYF